MLMCIFCESKIDKKQLQEILIASRFCQINVFTAQIVIRTRISQERILFNAVGDTK